jgi:hypothetical protein
MKKFRRFLKRLTSWARVRQDEQRLRAEIEEHLAFQTQDNLRAGLSPEEARLQAVLKFGAVEALKEDYRDRRGLPTVEALLQDVRYAVRRLRSPRLHGLPRPLREEEVKAALVPRFQRRRHTHDATTSHHAPARR